MIGIVSSAEDLHTVHVRHRLDELGAEHVLLDTGQVPTGVALTSTQDADGWRGAWGDVDLGTLRSMWWRRPQPFRIDDSVRDPHDRGFVRGECAAMVAGLWSCLDARWVNDPDRDEAASRKMAQLRLAVRLGLRVPRTCMTNDPERARAFLDDEPGAVVFKPFSATPTTWRETRPVREADRELLDTVRLAPVIFQEAVPGGVDVRVTIVGDQVHAAEIRGDASAYEYDFRVDASPRITPHDLPIGVEARLRRLMRRLGIVYGAVDLRVAPDGGYVFLEVNPAGQWLFVELATGQPITASLAALLHRLDRSATPAQPWQAHPSAATAPAAPELAGVG